MKDNFTLRFPLLKTELQNGMAKWVYLRIKFNGWIRRKRGNLK